MQRPLPKSAGILALFLAIPILCLAWTADHGPASTEFDDRPGLSDSLTDREGAPFPDRPETAINVPAGSRKTPAVPKPLYAPNAAHDRKDSQTAGSGLASFLSFLLPTKEDLEKCFKGEDDGFRDRGKSASDPFRKRDWK
jgi:hypothetical protein